MKVVVEKLSVKELNDLKKHIKKCNKYYNYSFDHHMLPKDYDYDTYKENDDLIDFELYLRKNKAETESFDKFCKDRNCEWINCSKYIVDDYEIFCYEQECCARITVLNLETFEFCFEKDIFKDIYKNYKKRDVLEDVKNTFENDWHKIWDGVKEVINRINE